MGKIWRGGYLFIWWKGDHEPRHVHVFDGKNRLLGRLAIPSHEPLDDWRPPRKVIEILDALRDGGRL